MSTDRLPLHVVHTNTPFQPAPEQETPSADPFPSARYFQVHFQHLQESDQQLRQDIADLDLRIDRLNRHLEQITAILGSVLGVTP